MRRTLTIVVLALGALALYAGPALASVRHVSG